MSQFPETLWPMIDLACNESKTGSREHMGKLLETYWQPMYAHVRFKGVDHQQAEDLVQEFSLQILNNDLLAIADPARGKFRTLLLTALDRFIVSRFRYETAAKRAPDSLGSLDAAEVDFVAAGEAPVSAAFDRAYALDVIAQVLSKVKEECEAADDVARWEIFENRVIGPMLDSSEVLDYAALAERHGLKDEKAAMNLLVTAKRQFTRILRSRVRDYVTRSADVDHYVEAVERDLNEETSDRESSIKAATEITERAVALLVEEEIDSLKKILESSRGTPQVEIDPTRSSAIYQSGFLARLNQTDLPVDVAYDWGSESAEDFSDDVIFCSILDTKLQEIGVDQPGTVRDALLSNPGEIDAITAVKNWVNLQRVAQSPTIPRELATGVYYSAIAAALVHCDQRISSLQNPVLAAGINGVAEAEWVHEDLRPLLEAAKSQLT